MTSRMTAPERPAVKVTNLRRDYGERTALCDVSFSLDPGQTLAVVGPNGAGKSTLVMLLATLVRPHGGDAVVLGHDLVKDPHSIRGKIGLLAHQPLLYRDLSPRDNLRFQARLHKVSLARADDLLQEVGLAARADEPLHTLSRGMVQRVAICRTVLHNPQLLLLDEPYANLDPGAIATVEPLIGAETGRTRIVITHSEEDAMRQSDLILGLRNGAPHFLKTPEQITEDELASAYR